MEILEQRCLLAVGGSGAELSIAIDDDSISENGGTTSAVVSRNTDTTSSLTVTLASSDESEATVPEFVTIPAGKSASEPFVIEAVDDPLIDGTQTATITASAATSDRVLFSDDFSSDDIDPFWKVEIEHPGATVTQSGGVLSIHSPDPPTGFLDIGLESETIYAASDFVASVDFRVPQGTALPWLSLAQHPEETAESHVYGLYLYRALEYRVWHDDNVVKGNELVAPGFGNEQTVWHRMRLEYDAETMTATSYIDNLLLDSFVLNLDQAVVRIFMKDNDSFGDGPSTVEFDNFEFSYLAPFQNGTASIDVTDDESAGLTLSITDEAISENGGTTTATVSRNSDTTNPLVVSLSSSDTGEAEVPETVTIGAGETTSDEFTISGVDDLIFDTTQRVTITATADGHTESADAIDVTNVQPKALTLTIDEASISENGGTTTATVTRNDGTVGDLTVSLHSNDTTAAIVPESVTIADGADSASFTVTGVDDAVLDETQTAIITASTATSSYVDDFSSDEINPFWKVDIDNPSASVTQSGGVLSVTSSFAPSGFLDAGLESATIYPASNFVASVDFRVPQGNALPWLSLAQDPEEDTDSHVYGLYLYRAFEYRVWQDDNNITGNTLVAPGIGDERTAWHRMRLEYDADTMTASAFLDDIPLNSFQLDLDQAVVRIFMKDSAEFGVAPSTVLFDNFDFSYVTPYEEGSDSVDVTDDDVADLAVTTTTGSTVAVTEAGDSSTVSVSLTAQPHENVVVLVSATDSTEAGLLTDSLTFTPDNWEVVQDIVVTGRGDLEDDGDVAFSVILQVDANQSDPVFSTTELILPGVNADVLVTNLAVKTESGQVMFVNQDTGIVLGQGDAGAPMSVDLSDADMSLEFDQLVEFDGVLEINYQREDTLVFGQGWNVEPPRFVDGIFTHVVERETTTLHLINEKPHQNPYNPFDVDRSGDVTGLDALIGINYLRQVGSSNLLPLPGEGSVFEFYYDASGDRHVTSLDALQVINDLKVVAEAEAEEILLAPENESMVEPQDSVFAEQSYVDVVHTSKQPGNKVDGDSSTNNAQRSINPSASAASDDGPAQAATVIDWVLKGWLED